MNNKRPFLKPIEILASEVKAKADKTLTQGLAEMDSSPTDTSDSTGQIFRSHFACEQG